MQVDNEYTWVKQKENKKQNRKASRNKIVPQTMTDADMKTTKTPLKAETDRQHTTWVVLTYFKKFPAIIIWK